MHRRRSVLQWVLALSLLGGLSCERQVLVSHWAEKPVQVDGKGKEWRDSPLIYFETARASCGLQNDNSYLYLLWITRSPLALRMMMTTGLTLWFDSTGKKKKLLGLRYPGGEEKENAAPGKSSAPHQGKQRQGKAQPQHSRKSAPASRKSAPASHKSNPASQKGGLTRRGTPPKARAARAGKSSEELLDILRPGQKAPLTIPADGSRGFAVARFAERGYWGLELRIPLKGTKNTPSKQGGKSAPSKQRGKKVTPKKGKGNALSKKGKGKILGVGGTPGKELLVGIEYLGLSESKKKKGRKAQAKRRSKGVGRGFVPGSPQEGKKKVQAQKQRRFARKIVWVSIQLAAPPAPSPATN